MEDYFRRNQQDRGRGGFTLIESLLALSMVLLLSVFLSALATVRVANRSSAYKTQAAMLVEEEINALRNKGVALLPTQTSCSPATNCPLWNVLYNAGHWRVVNDGTDAANHTVPNVLELKLATGFSGTPSGILQFPEGTYGDATFTAKFKATSDSVSNSNPATGWSVGYVVRASDERNQYRLRIGENSGAVNEDFDPGSGGTQNIILEKVTNGTATKISSATRTIAKNTWYSVVMAVSGTSTVTFTLQIDGSAVALPGATDSTSPYATGTAALIGWNGVHAEFDDIQTVAAATNAWNFDVPVTPTMPAAWVRLGLNDLPDATSAVFNDNGYVVIEPYPDGSSTTLKRATVTVTWHQGNAVKSYSAATFISDSAFGI